MRELGELGHPRTVDVSNVRLDSTRTEELPPQGTAPALAAEVWRLAQLALRHPRCRDPRLTRWTEGDSDSLHDNRGNRPAWPAPSGPSGLGRHDTSDPFGECDDDQVDSRATASSGPQSSGAASDELVDCGQRRQLREIDDVRRELRMLLRRRLAAHR